MEGSSLMRTAHGTAARGGALVVVESPPLDEIAPPNAERTARGLAIKKARGRPFQPRNRAAAGRGPNLTRITVDRTAPEEQQRIHRKAQNLCNRRRRELEVQTGGDVSSAVRVELVAWARATAWAEHFDRAGDATTAAGLAEKASQHGLKAIALAEREAKARPKANRIDELRAQMGAKKS